MKIIFSVLIFVAVSASADAKKKCFTVDAPTCKKFEIFSDCAPEACKKTCTTLDTACKAPCVPGCKCPEGLVYKDDNRDSCVLPKDCPSAECKKPNEERAGCETKCGGARICEKPRKDGLMSCFCKDGYVRNKEGDCVLPEKCPVPECKKPNEIRTGCETKCGGAKKCEKLRPGAEMPCYCKDGYVRDDEGNCVLPEKCPATECKKPNEIRTGCETDCDGNEKCASVVPGGRLPCFCKDDYVRDNEGNCILPEKCPVPACKKPNEERTDCETDCGGRKECARPKKGEPLPCMCKDGYVRDKEGNCILPEKCPVPECKKPNEIRTDCETDCNGAERCDRPRKGELMSCYCKDGYVRDKEGNCVLPKDCPSTKCKKPNEERSDCETECGGKRECARPQKGEPLPCMCKSGYVRDKEGNCILPEKCPVPKCKKPNEIRTGCETECGGARLCADIMPGGFMPCFCKPDYVRDKEGNCILPEKCPAPACKKPNEERTDCETDCGGGKECARPKKGEPLPCMCKSGYVRNNEGDCVLPEKCPVPKCTDPREERSGCETNCNGGKKCVKIAAGALMPCFCKDGYVRNNEGDCVLPEKCAAPKCTGANEIRTGCQTNCDGATVCASITPGGLMPCFCKEGYVRDSGKCILPEDCPSAECKKPNEERTGCEIECGGAKKCVKVAEGEQLPCFCVNNYFRDKEGNCVRVENCPAPKCKDPNEIRTGCEKECNRSKMCVEMKPGFPMPCFCKSGYERYNGKCVLSEKCPT